MILKQLELEGKIRGHKTSRKEITDLFNLIERDLRDASFEGVSFDRRFAMIYNAVLALEPSCFTAGVIKATARHIILQLFRP